MRRRKGLVVVIRLRLNLLNYTTRDRQQRTNETAFNGSNALNQHIVNYFKQAKNVYLI